MNETHYLYHLQYSESAFTLINTLGSLCFCAFLTNSNAVYLDNQNTCKTQRLIFCLFFIIQWQSCSYPMLKFKFTATPILDDPELHAYLTPCFECPDSHLSFSYRFNSTQQVLLYFLAATEIWNEFCGKQKNNDVSWRAIGWSIPSIHSYGRTSNAMSPGILHGVFLISQPTRTPRKKIIIYSDRMLMDTA